MFKESWAWLLFFLGCCVIFMEIEIFALRHPERQWTLSRTISYIGSVWPLSIWIFGAFAGGLAVHFFWHFCP